MATLRNGFHDGFHTALCLGLAPEIHSSRRLRPYPKGVQEGVALRLLEKLVYGYAFRQPPTRLVRVDNRERDHDSARPRRHLVEV